MTTPGPGPVLGLVALHVVVAAAAAPLVQRFGRRGLLLAGVAPAAALVWAIASARGILDGTPVEEQLRWAPDLGFEIPVRVDAFSLLMVFLVSGIGVLVFAYASEYFERSPELGRLAGLLVGFAGAMLGLVVTDNLLAIYLFWEATSITSYLLIGIDDRSATARSAALRALLTTSAGGLAMLGGFVLLARETGTWTLSEIVAASPRGTVVEVALVLVLLGAFTKSAQVPFHFWLPGAMAAPTPVSAYLHSATMVKAGVYLIARLAPAFADLGAWRPLVISVGVATMLLGAWRALSQHDLKLLLAHGTTSQLGFMVVLLGAGTPETTFAGAVLLLAHGAYKATLFMVVGIVDKQTGSRDIRKLDGLRRPLPRTFIVAAIAAASMAGLPPLLGFIAKESAYEALLHTGLGLGPLALAGVVLGSVLTFGYSARALWGTFGDKSPEDLAAEPVPGPVRPPSRAFLLPAAVLAALTVVLGLAPAPASDLVEAATRGLDGLASPSPLALWHGVTGALGLSLLTIAAGSALWVARRQVERVQRGIHVPPSGARTFDFLVLWATRAADRVTGVVQTGSLPVYLYIILTTLLVVPGVFLVTEVEMPTGLRLVDRPVQLGVVAAMALATLIAIVTRHRLGAVLAVGAVGYGVAVLFIIQGAPDLALTQLLVETLLLVLFVLVLRHLPRYVPQTSTALPVGPRAALAVLVGLFTSVFTIIAVSSRPDVTAISGEIARRALPEAGGRNIVNTILVDFRAFDTLGEISVLAIAALGVIGLVRAARRERVRPDTSPAAGSHEPSLILDNAVRALFHTVIAFSIVLLVNGHDEPGGGFIGGLLAGAGFMLVYLAGGVPRLVRTEPLAPELFLGGGVSVAAFAGVVGWFRQGEFLESALVTLDIPLLGTLKLGTVLLFDLGVYLVVVGMVIALLRSLGREEVRAR